MYLGSLYVTSFNEFGRYWQVTIQADGKYRNRVEDINQLRYGTNGGKWSSGRVVNVREMVAGIHHAL